MKIGIVSDMHLGYERFRADAYSQAKRALEMAAASCDMILIPGDVFDSRTPAPDVIAEGINLFREISKKEWKAHVLKYEADRETYTDVPIVAVSGTHERTAIGRDNALRLLDLAGLLVDTSEARTTIQKGEEKIAVYGIGGVSEELFKSKITELGVRPVIGVFNIFMFHQSLYEILPFNEQFMRLDELPEGFDLYIDGHLHTKNEQNVHGKKFLVPGSTVITQMKDAEQSSKGFIIFDTKTYSYEFVEIGSRPFVAQQANVSGKSGEEIRSECSAIIESIIKESNEPPIIRIKLEGELRPGISNSDMSLKNMVARYSKSAFIEIDSSKITNKSMEEGIESVRSSKIRGESIKERGLDALNQTLAGLGFSLSIKPGELMDLLTNSSKKEKFADEILELLDSGSS